ncbi:MAG: hypothetical protein B7Y80_01715 [Hyphomicrobium sp. 32-62-53]|nr:MAG: hypothetical protein B7Z29_02065 [Hyphomicrobium sp. 12-62-95]OYY01471.1 MAG: hypothetical protein B7Y80_01715 [Hyphomicrobium sp. 32-62-53]
MVNDSPVTDADAPLSVAAQRANVTRLRESTPPRQISRQAGLSELRAQLEKLTEAQFRDALEVVADEAQRRQAGRLLGDVAEERRLEALRGAALVQITGRLAANQPGGVA